MKATVCASLFIAATAMYAAPAFAAESPTALTMPIFTVQSKSATTTTTTVKTGTIAPIQVPVSPIVKNGTTTTVPPITDTPPVLGGETDPDNDDPDTTTPVSTPSINDSADDPDSNLARTGVDTMRLIALGMLLTGIGLAFWWFGNDMRSRAAALRTTSTRSKRN